MPRGFLPWGLSNTCPQGGAIRAPVACDGQVSDNPKQHQSVATGSKVAAQFCFAPVLVQAIRQLRQAVYQAVGANSSATWPPTGRGAP